MLKALPEPKIELTSFFREIHQLALLSGWVKRKREEN